MNKLKSKLIAPCGMNCGICLGYLREKNKCPGCRMDGRGKPNFCRKCTLKYCEEHKGKKSVFCFECDKYPCRRLKQLDKRYRTNYGMSMLENLQYIQEKGIQKFMVKEEKRWTCKKCHSIVCVHRPNCLDCGAQVVKTKYNI
ncbi:MAG: DUF3795 domain-containing protein [Patescibacteria group bacterium]